MVIASFFSRPRAGLLARAGASVCVLVAAVLLSGCASTLQTQVTNFHAWPQDAKGARFALEPQAQGEAEKWSELEKATYLGYVSEQLKAQGLQPATADAPARFRVSVRLDTRQTEVARTETVYAPAGYPYGTWGGPFYSPWRGMYYDDFEDGVFARPYGPYGSYAYGPYWPSAAVPVGQRSYTVPVRYQLLTVRISDFNPPAGSGKVVFESAAQYAGDQPLPAVMPYLVRAVFDQFPGHNGKVRMVGFEVK